MEVRIYDTSEEQAKYEAERKARLEFFIKEIERLAPLIKRTEDKN
jgi:hypothetical protein